MYYTRYFRDDRRVDRRRSGVIQRPGEGDGERTLRPRLRQQLDGRRRQCGVSAAGCHWRQGLPTQQTRTLH